MQVAELVRTEAPTHTDMNAASERDSR